MNEPKRTVQIPAAAPDLEQHEKVLTVYALVDAFIAKHKITCAETIYQVDAVILNAPTFIEKLCEVAGYHVRPDDTD